MSSLKINSSLGREKEISLSLSALPWCTCCLFYQVS